MSGAVKKIAPTGQLALPLIRQFIKELNHIECKHTPDARYSWKQSDVYEYVMKESTSGRNMTVLSYYVTLLKAIRCNKEIQAKYKGVGERSVEETARMVGLKMPKLYQDPND